MTTRKTVKYRHSKNKWQTKPRQELQDIIEIATDF